MHAAGEADADKRRMLKQLEFLDANYSGGLAAYISNAKRLLEESRTGMLTRICRTSPTPQASSNHCKLLKLC